MPSIILTATQKAYNASLPGFLREHPIPTETGQPPITEAAWIKQILTDYYYREAKQGLKKIAGESVTLEKVFE